MPLLPTGTPCRAILHPLRALAAAVDRALGELPERRREVFVLIRYHGLSYQETAEVMGISPQTVANQMSAALAALRRSLAPCMAAPPRPRPPPSLSSTARERAGW